MKTIDPRYKYNREFVLFSGVSGVMDYYAVIAAFPELPEEIKHAIKKLLYMGVRDKGSEEQDVEEAKLSLTKYTDRLSRASKKPVVFGPPPAHLLKSQPEKSILEMTGEERAISYAKLPGPKGYPVP